MSEENTAKTPTVDPDLCIGCGLCVTTCADVFQLGDDGKSFVKDGSACANCNCQEAVDNCPAHAISWVEKEPQTN
ncbi:TPA: ferredoxin [Candidatus Berkelbacteria bacterium]|uniref:Ferredoxin n=1 Tax=Berkelbacteria bacterium GW2011_GWE1_39_12 TaxID=1618337 RepID=A0A0G4B3U4_9BACT|nr:MAG: frx-6, ferredoxin family protein, ferredoxin [Berkelbacteria bacterium GW2011_GWE1_39_12]HBO60682.1 ferredoxin [Candidatus Berkelbacteria bacterium]